MWELLRGSHATLRHPAGQGRRHPTRRYPMGQGRGASYQEVHHVGLVVPQRLHGMEDIHGSLVSEHLADNADGAE